MSKEIITPSINNSEAATQISSWVREKLGDHPEYDDAMQSKIDQWGLPWFRAGAVVVDYSSGKILLIHEARVQVKKIKDPAKRQHYLEVEQLDKNSWVDGDGGWNLPSGRLRPGESFEDGVVREVSEESGHRIAVKDIIDIRQGNKPDNLYIMPVYLARAVSGPAHYSTAETMEIGWFSVSEIRAMAKDDNLRSPEFVMNALDAYEKWGAQNQ